MIAAHPVATGRPFPPITVSDRHLSAAICDLLPAEMFTRDRSTPGGLVLTLLELDAYNLIRSAPDGIHLTEGGLVIFGTLGQLRERTTDAADRLRLMAAAIEADLGGKAIL